VSHQRTSCKQPASHQWLPIAGQKWLSDQLTPALEQVEQIGLARRPLERIRRRHGHPRHSPALSGQGVTGAGLGLFLRGIEFDWR
jgi:hypothetical protein